MDKLNTHLRKAGIGKASSCRQPFLDIIEDSSQLVQGIGAEHGYAGGTETGYSLEERRRGQMPADVQYSAVFVYTVDTLAYLSSY